MKTKKQAAPVSSPSEGDWSVDPAQPTRVIIKARPGFNGSAYRVADAYSSSAGLSNTPPRPEAIANARVIAQAKTLLGWVELLEQSLVYEIKRSRKDGDDEGANLKSHTLFLVRQDIAKAKDLPAPKMGDLP